MQKKQNTMLLLLLLLVSLILTPTAVWGQEPLRVTISEIRWLDFPYLRSFVTVTDAGGSIIRDLTAENFSLLEDGRNVNITDVEVADPNDISLAVALILDTSGSMYGEPLTQAQEAARAFVRSLGDNDLAAIIAFSNTAKVVQDFTSDKLVLENAINGIVVEEYAFTCLFDGAHLGVRETASQRMDRRAVVLMTDGQECGNDGCSEPCSIYAEEHVISRAKEDNIPIHTIGFQESVVTAPLIRMAESTEGTYRYAGLEDLTQVYQEIAEQLKYEYVLSFESRLPHDRQGHSLTANVVVGSASGTALATFQAHRMQPPPVLRIPGVVDGQIVEEPIPLTPEIISSDPIEQVTYQVNDELVHTATATPWSYTWDPEESDVEDNLFRVVARDINGVESDPVQFTLKLPPAPTPTPEGAEGETEEDDYTLYYILGGVAAVLLIGGGILAMLRTRTRPTYCPNCDRRLPADMVECPFCAQEAAAAVPDFGATPMAPPTSPLAPEPPTAYEPYAATPGAPVISPTEPYQQLPSAQPPPVAPTQVIHRPQVSAWMVVEQGEHQGHLFRIEKEALTIGRAHTNDIVLSERIVSGQHAKLRVTGNQVVIHDLASSNGTFVNGEKVLKHTLIDGDRVMIGSTTFVFKQTQVQG